ncbi:helix-turn-helix transcriptional regulator [bacterium]|nr:helix-turn-helix transcriptional regulator [bacterium]
MEAIELGENIGNLGSLVRSKRRTIGYTQAEVAQRVGVSTQHYSRIERGEYIPSLQTFIKISQVLEIDISGLNLNKGKGISSTMYEIVSLLEKFDITQQKAVLTFLKTMKTPA